MIIGVPKEVKDHETRVGAGPQRSDRAARSRPRGAGGNHAGEGSAITDREYMQAGATIVAKAAEVWRKADLVVKVKEPQPSEVRLLPPRPDAVHLPAPGAAAAN